MQPDALARRSVVRFACFLAFSIGAGCGASDAGKATAPKPTLEKAAETARADAVELLPERRLACSISRATNVDLSRQQDRSELQFEGKHRLELFLPAIPAPPDAGAVDTSANPVAPNADPRTRITADPDGLTRELRGSFNRVADHWPQRVELSGETGQRTFLLLIVTPSDGQENKVELFMTFTNDTLNYDLNRIYLGSCDVFSRKISVAEAQASN